MGLKLEQESGRSSSLEIKTQEVYGKAQNRPYCQLKEIGVGQFLFGLYNICSG